MVMIKMDMLMKEYDIMNENMKKCFRILESHEYGFCMLYNCSNLIRGLPKDILYKLPLQYLHLYKDDIDWKKMLQHPLSLLLMQEFPIEMNIAINEEMKANAARSVTAGL